MYKTHAMIKGYKMLKGAFKIM